MTGPQASANRVSSVTTTLSAGTKVSLVGDPTIVGVVTQTLVTGDDPKFEIFCGDGKTRATSLGMRQSMVRADVC